VKRSRVQYLCRECGAQSARWAGRCTICGAWNTIAEQAVTLSSGRTSHSSSLEDLPSISEIEADESVRILSGLDDFDQVLGGGIVPGSFLLIGGEPGVGKSTLILEIARKFPGKIIYFSGEESQGQIKMRADRLGIASANLFISREGDIDTICARIRAEKPDLAVIDSIQTVYRTGSESIPGSPNQLREIAFLLMESCKELFVPIIATGHITKDGNIAGPRLMEHMVDAVLYFESDRLNHYRILRAIKNRFGPVGEVAIFEMAQNGLREVGAIPAGELSYDVPGRVFSVFVEGSRALTVEVQALVSRTVYGPGKRMAEGLDSRRLVLMAAVLEKFLKLGLSESDIFVNLAGGLNADDPALDLAICASIISSHREIPMKRNVACVGEVGLSGEVRSVGRIQSRIRELAGLGFTEIFIPESNRSEAIFDGVTLIPVAHISDVAGNRPGS
jgi:DNA repair protein RadA/Sms